MTCFSKTEDIQIEKVHVLQSTVLSVPEPHNRPGMTVCVCARAAGASVNTRKFAVPVTRAVPHLPTSQSGSQ